MNLTGQVIARRVRQEAPGSDKRELIMLVGIVAVEPGVFKGEHQYDLVGIGEGGIIGLDLDNPKDVSADTVGDSPSGILKKPIWRV
jgi:hypothetical protein